MADPGTVVLRALDVGQGDAWLLVTPRGRILVDGGGSPDRAYEFGRLRLLPKLADLGAVSLDAVVLTHPHPDHARGLLAVLASLPVGRVVLPRGAPRNAFLDEVLDVARKRRIVLERVGAGERFEAAGLACDVLHPGDATYARAPENNGSLVLEGARGGTDAPPDGRRGGGGRAGPRRVRGRPRRRRPEGPAPRQPHVDDAAFLGRVAPRVALVGVGRRNRFGHPAPDVLRRLAAAGARVFRTDLDGDLALTLAGGRILPSFAEAVARSSP